MINKQEKLKKSNELPSWFTTKVLTCTKCDLHKSRRQVVLGRGICQADILFMGEAPGKTEDLLGEAFVGPSGRLLNEMIKDSIALIQHGRGESKALIFPTYYITNTVLCRPCESIEDDNRKPNYTEIFCCMANVIQIVNFVRPKIVIFLGKVAHEAYGKEFKNFSASIMHPAFLLRQGGKSSQYYMQSIRTIAEAIKELI